VPVDKALFKRICKAIGGRVEEEEGELACVIRVSEDRMSKMRKSAWCPLVNVMKKIAPDEINIGNIARWRVRDRLVEWYNEHCS